MTSTVPLPVPSAYLMRLARPPKSLDHLHDLDSLSCHTHTPEAHMHRESKKKTAPEPLFRVHISVSSQKPRNVDPSSTRTVRLLHQHCAIPGARWSGSKIKNILVRCLTNSIILHIRKVQPCFGMPQLKKATFNSPASSIAVQASRLVCIFLGFSVGHGGRVMWRSIESFPALSRDG
jgi:hypothetical protein